MVRHGKVSDVICLAVALAICVGFEERLKERIEKGEKHASHL